jgi:hypothetical protein
LPIAVTDLPMKKYTLGFAVVVIAFFIGLSAIYLFLGIQPAVLIPALNLNSFEENGPHSVLEGRAVAIQPYQITFDLPEEWLVSKYGKNLFLNRKELKEIYLGRGFGSEENRVIGSVVDFNDCAAHAGEKEWGSVVSDQARVYVVDEDPGEIQGMVTKNGLNTAEWVFDKATVTSGTLGAWHRSTITYLQTGSHTIMFRDIDFYSRSFAGKTVVFVFTHSVGGDGYVQPILGSLKERSAASP